MRLAEALEQEGIGCSTHWLQRHSATFGGARAEFRDWAGGLASALGEERAEAIILHYSVFSYSYRGLPAYVHPVVTGIRATGLPVVGLFHEYAYPWHVGGARGRIWAASQRLVLPELMRGCAAIVVTTDERLAYLSTRPWLPRRPVLFAPVFSNLPPSRRPAPALPQEGLIGLFGYAYEGAAAALVLDALGRLRERGLGVRLRLLGAPGRDSRAGALWSAGARERGLEQALDFSGVLDAQALADALAACEVLLHAEPSGPTARKGTLAGSLASGRPVVSIDGPLRWPELLEAQATLVVEPDPEALAGALAGLLADRAAGEAQGRRGGAFAREQMGVQRTARVVAGALAQQAAISRRG
jgi:glycosyltransferase involved in cell wall biosynthesis